ncbi:hypothetical protein Tco_0499206 [Tanacetum coccineum]
MLYFIVNNVHVDYVALIWEGLHYSLMHPTTFVPYPRLIKLIIDYILMNYPDIPNQTNELHHYVANDEVLQSIFNSGKTKGRAVPLSQSQPTESSQGTNRTLSAPRKQPDPETLIPTAKQIDVEILDDATQVSIALAKSAEEYEAQQNVKEHLLNEDVNKLVEGEESDANQFANEMMLSHEDLDTKIYLGNHNKSPEAKKVVECVFVDEEVDKETTEVASIQRKWKGSIEIRDTPLATPTRSPRTDSLSLDKEKLQESTASKPSSSLSKHKFDRSRHLRGAIACMSRRKGYMLQYTKKSFMPKYDMNTLAKKFKETLKEVEQERTRAELSSQVSNDIATNRDDKQAHPADFVVCIALKYNFEKPSSHNEPCRVDAFHKQDHEVHRD